VETASYYTFLIPPLEQLSLVTLYVSYTIEKMEIKQIKWKHRVLWSFWDVLCVQKVVNKNMGRNKGTWSWFEHSGRLENCRTSVILSEYQTENRDTWEIYSWGREISLNTFISGIYNSQNYASFKTCLSCSLEILTKITCLEFYLKPEYIVNPWWWWWW
jgi:hypothetical protein